tara:strand:+ start:1909 stop:2076 length:168 start_codon:yes stop_codon:yes gene_type:complete
MAKHIGDLVTIPLYRTDNASAASNSAASNSAAGNIQNKANNAYTNTMFSNLDQHQ